MKKEEQIRMLLHPEDYTNEQLDQMLDETNVPVPDANKQWEKFRSEKREVKSEKREVKRERPMLLKIAAMFIGVLMLSGIAYAAIHIVSRSVEGDLQTPTQEAQITNSPQQTTDEQPTDSTVMKPVVFEDAELGTILSEVATFYQYEVVYKSEASKHIRLYFTWDKKATIDDIIDTFNKFERIHITRDNKKLIVE